MLKTEKKLTKKNKKSRLSIIFKEIKNNKGKQKSQKKKNFKIFSDKFLAHISKVIKLLHTDF